MRELIAVLLWGFPLRFILSEKKFYFIIYILDPKFVLDL